MSFRDLLVEIGCEELPAREQVQLQESAADQFAQLLDTAGIGYGVIQPYIGPRRIAVLVQDLAVATRPEIEIRRGPTLERAFTDGKATAAAEGFARSCGVRVADLETLESDKGPVLAFRITHPSRPTAELLPTLANRWLQNLPFRKRMRWGKLEESFSRPIRWLLLRFGAETLPWQSYGLMGEAHSFGHRVHHPGPVPFVHPKDYVAALEQAKVRASWPERRQYIAKRIEQLAKEMDCQPLLSGSLLDEITGLNEWPVVLAGGFAEEFLRVPEEVLITVMIQHQRYVPLRSPNGRLAPRYAFVANLESRDPQVVIHGNNRVLRARLADATFFWDQDRQVPLAQRVLALDQVLFQEGLGSLGDKTRRLQRLVRQWAGDFGVDADILERAATLSKADLLTGMVGEFPELQGTMGAYYARHDQEEELICQAIGEHYRPVGREDSIPQSLEGQVLALADRLDTLAGFFALGKIPSGDRDPFGLRRAALAVLRIGLEGERKLSLRRMIQSSLDTYGPSLPTKAPACGEQILEFFADRLRVLLREEGFAPDQINAVLAVAGDDPLDTRRRLESLALFLADHPAAADLAALIKRVHNILRKEMVASSPVREELLLEPAEQALARRWQALRGQVQESLASQQYLAALATLAELREAVDVFFTEILVLCKDEALRNNRLALLRELQEAFGQIADFSLIQGRG